MSDIDDCRTFLDNMDRVEMARRAKPAEPTVVSDTTPPICVHCGKTSEEHNIFDRCLERTGHGKKILDAHFTPVPECAQAEIPPLESVVPTQTEDRRPDLHHPFECERGRESECSFFHNWLGGWVKCKLPENHPHHKAPFPVVPTREKGDGNPHGYERGWTIEQHRDELIDRLGMAIKRINELEKELAGKHHV